MVRGPTYGMAPPSDPRRKRALTKERSPDASTPNGRMIRGLMTARHVRGNYKDYVAISGDRLVDWLGSYRLEGAEPGALEGLPSVALIHKRELSRWLGDAAKRFWRRGIGRVNSRAGVERRRRATVVKG